MPQFSFGSGILVGVPLTDADGTAIANPTPRKFGTLQDVNVDFTRSIKELFGQKQFAVAIGAGTCKVTGKSKFARLNGGLVNDIFFGQSLSTATVPNLQDEESGTIPGTPYQITISPPNSGTFVRDLGVVYSATGIVLTRVASSPNTGEYSVSGAGVYTFAAADTTLGVKISYVYSETAGRKIVIANKQLGYVPTFRAELSAPYKGKKLTLALHSCVATKLSFATKLEDFMVPDFDFVAQADDADQIGTLAFSDL